MPKNLTLCFRCVAGSVALAHWQIFLAYAKYPKPGLHMWANQVVKEWFEETWLIEAVVEAPQLDEAARALVQPLSSQSFYLFLRRVRASGHWGHDLRLRLFCS